LNKSGTAHNEIIVSAIVQISFDFDVERSIGVRVNRAAERLRRPDRLTGGALGGGTGSGAGPKKETTHDQQPEAQ
jgi:hypothetical protein